MFNIQQRSQLLKLARQSITWGLEHGQALPVDESNFDDELTLPMACFITLFKNNQLRGCIGSLEAHKSLVKDVSRNAYSAAFRDPRFDILLQRELDELVISISVLQPAVPIEFESEQNLIEQLKPGVDGLILQEGPSRGTFLPSVWEQIADAKLFVQQLKLKAGLSADYWSRGIQVSRYKTESFSESDC